MIGALTLSPLEASLPDLLSELLAAPDVVGQAAVVDGWLVSQIDEAQLAAIKAKAAEVLRVDVQMLASRS